MNARARMQTAGSGEVAGSRVGGLSSRSCEAIRPPLKLQRHTGWRMVARVCGAGCRALRGWYKSGFEADCVTHHAIQTAARYCNSCIRTARFYATTILWIVPISRVFLALKQKLGNKRARFSAVSRRRPS